MWTENWPIDKKKRRSVPVDDRNKCLVFQERMCRKWRNGVVLEVGVFNEKSQRMFLCWWYWSRKQGEIFWCGKERKKITEVLHIKKKIIVLDLVKKLKYFFGYELEYFIIVINEKLEMNAYRSELLDVVMILWKKHILSPICFFTME